MLGTSRFLANVVGVRNRLRIARRVGVGIVTVVALAAVLCLDSVDYTPYFHSDYYKETAVRFESTSKTNLVESGPLFAGIGVARLTPGLNAGEEIPGEGKFRQIPLAGYGNRNGEPATGVHDDVWVKAVAVRVGSQTGIIFGADALIVPREVADEAAAQLRKETGLNREQLYFSATHTHCSIGGWGEGMAGEAFAGSFNPGARTWFASRFVAAARDALGDLRPAEFGQGSFRAPEFVRNRVVGKLGKVDDEFSFGIFRQEQGRSAVLGVYSAHATVLPGRVMEFSGDYPGAWQRAIEQSTNTVALFLGGAVGSHAPVAGESGFAGAERMGTALAARLQQELPQISFTNSIPLGFFGLGLSLPELNVRLASGIRLRPWFASTLLPVSRQSFLQGFRIGDTIWLSTPCDFSGELALHIKDSLRVRGFDAIITSFNGDYIGYVIPSKYYHLDGYEPRTMSFYGPYVPDYLEEFIGKIALDLSH